MPRHLCAVVSVGFLLTCFATASEPEALPHGALLRIGSTRFRHASPVSFVAFSPDGRQVMSASADNTLKVWDAETGRKRFETWAITDGHPPARFSADGKTLIYLGDGMDVRHVEIATGKLLACVSMSLDKGAAFAFGAEGATLAVVGENHAGHVYDTRIGGELYALSFRQNPQQGRVVLLHQIFVTPKGDVAVGIERTEEDVILRAWNLKTEKELRTRGKVPPEAVALDVSPDLKQLLLQTSTSLLLWDVDRQTTADLGVPLNSDGPFTGALSRDGKWIAVGEPGGVRLRETTARKDTRTLPAAKAGVAALAFSPDGTRLAAGGPDGVVRVWDVQTGKRIGPAEEPGGITILLAVSPDGTQLFTLDTERTMRLLDLATGQETRRLQPAVDREADNHLIRDMPTQAAFTADGAAVAVLWPNGWTVFWDASTGLVRNRLRPPEGGTQAAALAPEAQLVAWAVADHRISVRDPSTGKEVVRLSMSKPPADNGDPLQPALVQSVGFSPDGRTVLTLGTDPPPPDAPGILAPSLRLWEVASGKERLTVYVPQMLYRAGRFGDVRIDLPAPFLLRDELFDRVFGTNRSVGRLTVSEDHLWAAESGKPDIDLIDLRRSRLVTAGSNPGELPQAYAFAPGGKVLACEDAETRELVLTDLTRSGAVGIARGYGGVVTAVAFTANGRKLITASSDTTLVIWDVEALRQNIHKRGSPLARGELNELWDDLGGSDSRKAYKALWRLVEGQGETVRFLRDRLRPVPAGRPESLRDLRGTEVLELIGTAEAREVLTELAKGAPGARLTRDAGAALARLARRENP